MKKVFLIGDSIRAGYDKYVKIAFRNVADVVYPQENCKFSGYIIRHISNWKNELDLDETVDLVHWNAGLWDCLRMPDGKLHTSLDYYQDNIERICNIIHILFPKAKMIFATSTPVQEQLFVPPFLRYNQDIEEYNDVASRIVKKQGGSINDLYALMKDTPVEYHSDLTHYYTKEATQLMANQVIGFVEKTLDVTAVPLNYDEFFQKTEKTVGI